MGCRSLLSAMALVASLGLAGLPVVAQETASSDRVLAQKADGFNPAAVQAMINRGDAAAAARLKASAGLLGLLEADPDAWFRGGDGLDEAAIQKAIEARLNARKERNFAEADRIRDDLANQGILLEDTAEGTVWRWG